MVKLNHQHSYKTPHLIPIAQTYPLRSPNGSTVIVYGHNAGLCLVWRGGLPLKHEAESGTSVSYQAKGATNDEPMNIDDSDDNNEGSEAYNDDTGFEQQGLEHDPLRPFEPVIQTLDLPFDNIQVLHLAFLPLNSQLQQSNLRGLPSFLTNKMVIALACSDCTIRVLNIPLMPPSNKRRASARGAAIGKGFLGEQLVLIPSKNGHRNYPKGVSMTISTHSAVSTDEDESLDVEDHAWNLLVASHSAEISGLLLVHKLPLDEDGIDVENIEVDHSWRRQYLASPARFISFNTSLYPSRRHMQILVAESGGTVRVYDCLSKTSANRGSWLVSLYSRSTAPTSNIPWRKELLAAHWAVDGKAIVVLLADGEWGIWDIEGGGPKSKKASNGWQAAAGGPLANFSVSGWIGHSAAAKENSKSSKCTETRSQLAPMTPATRKVRQENLFVGSVNETKKPAHGGVSTHSVQLGFSNRKDDETLLLWHGTTIVVIPSLLSYWQDKVQGSGSLFSNSSRGKPKEIKAIRQGQERWNAVSLILNSESASGDFNASNPNSILIAGDHRFCIIGPPLTEPTNSAMHEVTPKGLSSAADQVLLTKGELDLDGIDHVLEGISNGHHTNRTESNGRYMRHGVKLRAF